MIPQRPVMQKDPLWVSEKFRRAVAHLPCAVCGIEGFVQCAHANSSVFGKGMGRKSHDFASFPLCHAGANGCHEKHDQRTKSMSWSEVVDYEHNLIGLTHQKLFASGLIGVEMFEEVKARLLGLFKQGGA